MAQTRTGDGCGQTQGEKPLRCGRIREAHRVRRQVTRHLIVPGLSRADHRARRHSAGRGRMGVGCEFGHWGRMPSRHLSTDLRLAGVLIEPSFVDKAAESGAERRMPYGPARRAAETRPPSSRSGVSPPWPSSSSRVRSRTELTPPAAAGRCTSSGGRNPNSRIDASRDDTVGQNPLKRTSPDVTPGLAPALCPARRAPVLAVSPKVGDLPGMASRR